MEQKDLAVKSPTANMHRDELRPGVRSYADKLQEQIKDALKKAGVVSSENIESALADPKLSSRDLAHIHALTKKLYEISQAGEIPYNEDEYIDMIARDVIPKCIPVLENANYLDLSGTGEADEEKIASTVLEAVASVRVMPGEIFQQDSETYQRFVEKIAAKLPAAMNGFSGLFTACIYDNAVADYPLAEQIHQEIQLDDLYDFVGFGHAKGTLVIHGKAGNFTAIKMKGGTIIAEETGDYLGQLMSDGIISVDKTGVLCGSSMTNGTIFINEGGESIGAGMRGGRIEALIGGNEVGEGMYGGEILIGSAGDRLGTDMYGGTITCGNAGEKVGYRMKGGIIFISVNHQGLGTQRQGGKIYFRGQPI